jgi:asparagine synthase (glutamine-hydrolysing)
MCGITGYWAFTNAQDNLPKNLSIAVDKLRHRGPDDSGLWFNDSENVGLGHTRLSIIDLSEHASQPMISLDGRYVLVFNGEIYNYKEIRKELEQKGHRFRGSGDTEVILSAYAEWGKECVSRFIGMFAFAIWDKKKQQLSLCRDRIGIKPLYYSWKNKIFCFGSELKALNEYHHIGKEINLDALAEYFQYGYISAPRSIYNNVHKLLPGCWLELDLNEKVMIKQYWSVHDAIDKGQLKGSEDEFAEELEELLIDAFKYRMVSDVPVGVFLSGGIDSSLVAAILQKHTNQQISTFTIGFQENEFDESVWAKEISKKIGTNHTEYILELERAKEIIPKIPEIYDEPFGDHSSIPTYIVSELARKDVKVILSGDGGDELFGGYSSYGLIPERVRKLRALPYPLRYFMSQTIDFIPESMISNTMSMLNRIGLLDSSYVNKGIDRFEKVRLVMPDVNESEVFNMANSTFLPNGIRRLIGEYSLQKNMINDYKGQFQEQMMLWDFHHFMPDDVLVKVDRATMAVALEGREPLLDHRIAEFAFRLPLSMRTGDLGSKHLLRKVLYKYLPKDLIDRPKRGFGIPLESWLKKDLSFLLDDYLNTNTIKNMGVLDPYEVDSIVKSFKKGAAVSANRVWLLLMFSMWHEKNI